MSSLFVGTYEKKVNFLPITEKASLNQDVAQEGITVGDGSTATRCNQAVYYAVVVH